MYPFCYRCIFRINFISHKQNTDILSVIVYYKSFFNCKKRHAKIEYCRFTLFQYILIISATHYILYFIALRTAVSQAYNTSQLAGVRNTKSFVIIEKKICSMFNLYSWLRSNSLLLNKNRYINIWFSMDVDLQDLPPVGDHIVRQHIGFSSLGNHL